MFCQQCGTQIADNAKFCGDCGASASATVVQQVIVQQQKPLGKKVHRSTAFLLAFFLGGFGIHKFYLGKTVQAIFMLLFFWTGIPAIIAFVEAVIYLCMSDASFDNNYNKEQ
ncbi:MAG: NINE protein [Culicoidibacterales bacterium]